LRLFPVPAADCDEEGFSHWASAVLHIITHTAAARLERLPWEMLAGNAPYINAGIQQGIIDHASVIGIPNALATVLAIAYERGR